MDCKQVGSQVKVLEEGIDGQWNGGWVNRSDIHWGWECVNIDDLQGARLKDTRWYSEGDVFEFAVMLWAQWWEILR